MPLKYQLTELRQHEGLIANDRLKPSLLVPDRYLPLHQQRPLGIMLWGATCILNPEAPLSDRQAQVATLMMTGLSNDACAGALYLSVDTIKTHLKKLGEGLPRLDGTVHDRSSIMRRMLLGGHLGRSLMRVATPIATGVVEVLAVREGEVARLASRGLSNTGIATEMEISHATVKSHLARAGGKLGTGDRTLIGEALLISDMVREEQGLQADLESAADPFAALQDTDLRTWYAAAPGSFA